jgi:hypothetical protein
MHITCPDFGILLGLIVGQYVTSITVKNVDFNDVFVRIPLDYLMANCRCSK